MTKRWLKFGFLLCVVLSLTTTVRAQEMPAVNVVLFYLPTCAHCHKVMTETFPPLREQYGDQLFIAEIDASTDEGSALFLAAQEKYQVGGSVPLLIIDDYYLLGSADIPNELPGLIETYLSEGGIGLPDLPNIESVIAGMDPTPYAEKIAALEESMAATEESTATSEENTPMLAEIFSRDVAGNTLSTIVLVGLVAAFFAVIQKHRWQATLAKRVMPYGFYVVMVIGLIAAGYLTYVEMTRTEAVCGPVGDCNAVQESKYALLFGFMPVALLGLIGYFAILASYLFGIWGKTEWAKYTPAVTFFLVLFGLAFSIYLTFLEPFVIGATCAWCLTSALCMLFLALFTADNGWQAIKAWNNDAWRRSAKRRAAKKASQKR